MTSLGTAVNLVPFDIMFDLVDATKGQYDFNKGFYAIDCSSKFTWSLIVGGQELKVSVCGI